MRRFAIGRPVVPVQQIHICWPEDTDYKWSVGGMG